MKRKLSFLIIVTLFVSMGIVFAGSDTNAYTEMGDKLKGRVLLQVEELGEGWYVNPADYKRYYLDRPLDAWNIMRFLGLGITNEDLDRIPTKDDNWDGDAALIDRLKGYILLQVEEHGEAWYISPVNGKRYYMGRPDDAFSIMRFLGLGITNNDLFKIDPNIEISYIQYIGIGWETNEYIDIKNAGSMVQDYEGWKIKDEAGHKFVFHDDARWDGISEFLVYPGYAARVQTDGGLWSFNSKTPIWNDDGDTAYLYTPNGTLVDTYTY